MGLSGQLAEGGNSGRGRAGNTAPRNMVPCKAPGSGTRFFAKPIGKSPHSKKTLLISTGVSVQTRAYDNRKI